MSSSQKGNGYHAFSYLNGAMSSLGCKVGGTCADPLLNRVADAGTPGRASRNRKWSRPASPAWALCGRLRRQP